jgi:hypothetical protein
VLVHYPMGLVTEIALDSTCFSAAIAQSPGQSCPHAPLSERDGSNVVQTDHASLSPATAGASRRDQSLSKRGWIDRPAERHYVLRVYGHLKRGQAAASILYCDV